MIASSKPDYLVFAQKGNCLDSGLTLMSKNSHSYWLTKRGYFAWNCTPENWHLRRTAFVYFLYIRE